MVLQWYPVHEISFVCFFLVPVLLLTFLYVSMVVVIKTATKASIRSTFSSHLSFAINNKWVDVFSGKPLTWKNWAKNQPASLSEDQDCAVINKNGFSDLTSRTHPDHLTTIHTKTFELL